MKLNTLKNALEHSPSTWQAVYCAHYAPGLSWADVPETANPPPSRQHAKNLFATFVSICTSLESSGIEVHQEGALARFHAAATPYVPAFGRPEGAVAARKKTLDFCAALIEAAVALRGASTFAIPATEAQGYFVVAHESLSTLRDFHTARAAAANTQTFVTPAADRPELVLEQQRHQAVNAEAVRLASRAAAMHQTATAEVIGAGLVADRGLWFRQAKPDGSDAPRGVFVIGVEVPNGSPVLASCQANLDPQHGGGTYGLGGSLEGQQPPHAACDAALRLVQGGLPLYPESTRYVATRLDPDAFVAALILSRRWVEKAITGHTGPTERLWALAKLDSSAPSDALGWAPGTFEPASVADCPIWGPLAALCVPHLQGRISLAELEAAAVATLFDLPGPAALGDARRAHAAAWESARSLSSAFQVRGSVAIGTGPVFAGPPRAGQWAAAYAVAPVALLHGSHQGKVKYTIAVSRRVGPKAIEFSRNVREKLNAIEDKSLGRWGGPETITGNPQGQGSRLTLDQVVAACEAAAQQVGIAVTGSPAQTPWLR